MKVLVTGGAGFIGSALVRFLVEKGDVDVVNVDKLTYAGNLESLGAARSSARHHFDQADVCDRDALQSIFAEHRPDVVVHMAAETHVDRSIDGADAFLETNLLGTGRLLQAALEYWNRLTAARREHFRFLHVSSDEVYGDLPPDAKTWSETSPYEPSSPYAATKAGSDHLVRAWGYTYELPILVTNSSNNYGPFQFPEKLIPHMIVCAVQGQPLPVYGDGLQIRDWLYVDDHARALWTVLRKGNVGETYNIGAHNERRNIDVVRHICAILESALDGRPTGRLERLITFVADRPGHDRRYAIDARKIGRELGWRPVETFASGLEKTVHWYVRNRTWWERVLDGRYRLERAGIGADR